MPSTRSSIEDLLPEIDRLIPSSGERGNELDDASGVLSALRKELVHHIDALLRHRRELLMSVLYRVDVKESVVVDAFRNLPPEMLAHRLADLIIERQIEKVRSRRAFRDDASR